MFSEVDKHWMQQAIQLADYAESLGEVPVGALLVQQGEMIGQGYNSSIQHKDPTAHAELMAIRSASLKLGNYRLLDSILYTTLEPCIMCVGAIIHARIKWVIFGAFDLKAGAVVSQIQGFNLPFTNHKVNERGGLLADQCGLRLTSFFKNKRSCG